MKDKLTAKQERFCVEYIANHFNGTRAMRAAGFKGSYNVLGVEAHRMLKKPKIQRRIKELTEEYFDDRKKVGREALKELEILAHRRVSDVVRKTKSGNIEIKDFSEMGEAQAAVNKIETKETIIENSDGDKIGSTVETKVTLEGKTRPLETLLKYSGEIVEKVEVDNKDKTDIDFSKIPPEKLDEFINLLEKAKK